jgi:hypothetical protein
LIVAPTLDRYARVEDVRREVEEAHRIYERYDRRDALQLNTPLEFNRFSGSIQGQVFDWLDGLR